eukprot:1105596-Pelagomonas_calceolata.AAC.9
MGMYAGTRRPLLLEHDSSYSRHNMFNTPTNTHAHAHHAQTKETKGPSTHRLRVLQPLVRNDDGVLAEQRHHAHVRVPHHILHGWGGQLRQAAALLHVQKCDLHKDGPSSSSSSSRMCENVGVHGVVAHKREKQPSQGSSAAAHPLAQPAQPSSGASSSSWDNQNHSSIGSAAPQPG